MIQPCFPNSALVRAPKRFVLKGAPWESVELPVRYGVFDHADAGRCLIDTGYSARVLSGPRSLPLRVYASVLNPKLTDHALPMAEPEATCVLLTHLHADHVSALKDYREARLVGHRGAVKHFLTASAFSRTRHGCFNELLPGDLLARLEPVEALLQVQAPLWDGTGGDVFGDGSVLAIDLPGHMLGHTGYLFTESDPPILYAGDAQWFWTAIEDDRAPGFPGSLVAHDHRAARDTAKRLKAFHARGGKVVLCHDPEMDP